MAAEIDDRIARLEEHLVQPVATAEDDLERAEKYLARGWETLAAIALSQAKTARMLDELDDDDDA